MDNKLVSGGNYFVVFNNVNCQIGKYCTYYTFITVQLTPMSGIFVLPDFSLLRCIPPRETG